jgi:hypothetical protein
MEDRGTVACSSCWATSAALCVCGGGGGMGVGVVGRGAPGGEVKERGHDRCGGVGLE